MKRGFGNWKILLAALAFVFACSFADERVYADELNDSERILDGSVLTNDLESTDIETPRLKNSFLAQGIVKITNNGNGVVGIGGITQCFYTCDVVKLNLYLERSKGSSSFSSYKSFSYTEYNTNSLGHDLEYAVEKGYYYRLRGYHYASKNGQAENLISRTNGIYIG